MSTVESSVVGLTYEFTYRCQLAPPLEAGPGPYGARMIFELTGGSIAGERLNGEVLSGGAGLPARRPGRVRPDRRPHTDPNR